MPVDGTDTEIGEQVDVSAKSQQQYGWAASRIRTSAHVLPESVRTVTDKIGQRAADW